MSAPAQPPAYLLKNGFVDFVNHDPDLWFMVMADEDDRQRFGYLMIEAEEIPGLIAWLKARMETIAPILERQAQQDTE